MCLTLYIMLFNLFIYNMYILLLPPLPPYPAAVMAFLYNNTCHVTFSSILYKTVRILGNDGNLDDFVFLMMSIDHSFDNLFPVSYCHQSNQPTYTHPTSPFSYTPSSCGCSNMAAKQREREREEEESVYINKPRRDLQNG